MPDRNPPSGRGHDLVLVCGVAAVVLGVALVVHGGLLAEPATQRVASAHAVLMVGERVGPVQEEHLTADTSTADSAPPMPAPQTASCMRPRFPQPVPRVTIWTTTCA